MYVPTHQLSREIKSGYAPSAVLRKADLRKPSWHLPPIRTACTCSQRATSLSQVLAETLFLSLNKDARTSLLREGI